MLIQNHALLALNHLIVEYTITAQNARFCHWNVVGPHFEDDHELFGEIYDALSEEIDVFAERIRALAENPISRLEDMLAVTKLKEYMLPMTARQMQKNMLADYEYLSNELKHLIVSTEQDAVTQDILVGSKRAIDKKCWMLRSLL